MYAADRFDPFSLITGVLAIILGVLVLYDPIFSYQSMLTFLAVLAIVEGTFKLFELNGIPRSINFYRGWWIFIGIADILFGVLLFLFPAIGMVAVGATLAIWVLVDSLFELWLSSTLNNNNKGYYWLTIIFSLIGIIIGVFLLIRPAFAIFNVSLLLAVYLLIFGINQIVRSF